jgi:hypothetical protein
LETKARLIAYYLPQFHPIQENDEVWGKGFTEWTNVTKAKPLYKGHKQPKLPADLGFYDLRVPEVREAQAQMAQAYGIEGFCYWHYWFEGKRVIERPFEEVLRSGKPDFPFCLGWANHTWSGIWMGEPKKIIIEQTYGGISEYTRHFYAMLPAFQDKRYIKVEGKCLFVVFAPKHIPNAKEFTDCWRELGQKEGIGDFFFVGLGIDEPHRFGMDVSSVVPPAGQISRMPVRWRDKLSYQFFGTSFADQIAKMRRRPKVYSYADFIKVAVQHTLTQEELPCILSNWDNTPRSQLRGYVLEGCRPELFKIYCEYALRSIENKSKEKKIIFLRSWNEWAEGNYLEPDRENGYAYLEVIKDVFSKEKE